MNPKDHPGTSRGYLIAIIGTVVWSSTAVIIRFLNLHYAITPLLLAMLRDLLAGSLVLLGVLIFLKGVLRTLKQHFPFLLLYGFILSIFNMTWTISVKLNGAAISTVLAYSSPVFTVLAGRWIYKERLGWWKGVIIFFCIAGCVLVAGATDLQQWIDNPLGIGMGLFSGLAFAGYSLAGKGAARRGLNSWAVLGVGFVLAAGFLLLYNLAFPASWGISSPQLLWQDQDWRGWFLLILLAAVPTIGGYGLYNLSLRYLPAGTSNLIATSEPVFTALQAVFILGERYTGLQLGGSFLILASILLMRIFFQEGD